MISRLIELVQSFSAQRVLLVGDLILDRYVYGDAERISPEAPVVVLRRDRDEERVGGAGSVAANLRELGIDVICAGVVGLDDEGHHIRALLESQRIGTRGILALPERPTTTKTRFIGLAQHRHRQQLIRVDDEVVSPLAAADAERFASLITQAVPNAAAVCLEDYNKGLLTEPLCREIIDAAIEAGKPVLVDPARISDYSKYRGATLLTPNRAEFQEAAQCADAQFSTIHEAIAPFLDRFGLDGVLVTLDREGCILGQRGRDPIHIPTRPRAVYDNTGAGDAVLAMLAASIVADASWEEAARLTNIAGGLEVEKFGCVPVTRDEVLAELRLASGLDAGKIRTPDELQVELTLRKERGETVVFTNGCYDLLHAGHVAFLNRCRELGSIVVVGLNSDASVKAQGKGEDRPIVPQDERADLMAGLQAVDYVTIFDEPTPAELIAKLTPDVLVKGEDWADKGVIGREHVEANGGEVVLLPLVPGLSTTELIRRIRKGGA